MLYKIGIFTIGVAFLAFKLLSSVSSDGQSDLIFLARVIFIAAVIKSTFFGVEGFNNTSDLNIRVSVSDL